MSNPQLDEGSQPTLLGQYAGFVTRLIAWIIDQVILAAAITITIGAGKFLLQVFPINEWLGLDQVMTNITLVVAIAVAITLPIVYNIGSWLLAGQTIGKWVMGVRIVRTNGERMRFGTCVRRQIGYLVSAILFLGYLWILVDNRRQGFHDKIAGTFVIYSWPESAPVRPIQDRVRRFRLQQQPAQDPE